MNKQNETKNYLTTKVLYTHAIYLENRYGEKEEEGGGYRLVKKEKKNVQIGFE